MPAPRPRALSISLTALALLATAGCAKATVADAPWGAPLDALTTAVESLNGGVSFENWITAAGADVESEGDEIPSEGKLRIVQTIDNGTFEVGSELRFVGDDLWMRIDGVDGKSEWGHFADGSMVAAMSNVVGPSVWVPELLAQVTTVERVSERKYGGLLDLTEADPDRTGLEPALTRDLPDEAEEVEFGVQLNADGSLANFTYEIENSVKGNMQVTYSFTMHGSPKDVTAPDGKIVGATDDKAVGSA